MTLDHVISKLGEKFIYINDVATTLYNSHTLCEQGNVAHAMLYGPAGHAKTAIARGFLQMMYDEPIFDKTAIGAGTTIYDLLGFAVPDEMMKGNKVFQYEYGFLPRPAALFDELLDAPANVLEQLKAVIMDKEHCVNGVVCYRSNCRFIIACTNHELADWVINPITNKPDNSRKAVLERFPFSYRVSWKSYEASDYSRLFEVVLKDPLESFSRMLELSAKKGKVISPRSAIIGAKSFKSNGLSGLTGIEDFDEPLKKDFEKIVRSQEQDEKVKEFIKQYNILSSFMDTISRRPDAENVGRAYRNVKEFKKQVVTLQPSLQYVGTVTEIRNKLDEFEDALGKISLKLITR